MTQDKIDEFIAKSKQLTGKTLKERAQWNTEASADAIRHFAYGISDDNPLWLDRDYAAQSRYGRLVAPPTFLTSVLYPALHGEPMDVPLSSLISELEYQWFYPIFEGDSLRASAKQIDVVEGKNRGGRRLVYILAETTYWNQHDQIVGKAFGTIVRIAQTGTELLLDRSVYHYNDEELAAIQQTILAETRRGTAHFTADEIKKGQSLPRFVRGPLTIGDMICWQAAIGPSYRAGALGYRDTVAAPHSAVNIPGVGWPVKYSQQHEDFTLAEQRGMPAPFDNSVMRFSWLSVLLTNWMGDNGFLKRLQVQMPEPILYGDATWYDATITNIANDTEGTIVGIKITGTNQVGQINTLGEAEIVLPPEVLSFQPEIDVVTPADTASTASLDGDQLKLLETWNDTEKVYPDTLNISEIFEAQVKKSPETIALRFEDQSLTYQQLNEQANQLAHYLQSNGVKTNTLVGICLSRSLEMVVSILGVLKVGGAYVPLDPTYPKERLAFMVQDADMHFLLTHTEILPDLPKLKTSPICLDDVWELVSQQSKTNLAHTTEPGQLAYVLYTSGTTTQPKGVGVPQSSLAQYVKALAASLPVTADDVYLHTGSFSFSASVRQTMYPLSIGAMLVIANETQKQDPMSLCQLTKHNQVTVWDTVPTFLHHTTEILLSLEAEERTALLENQLRLVFTTGEALRWSTPQAWQDKLQHKATLINLYSQTETAGTAACYQIQAGSTGKAGTVPLGRPLENAQIHLLDQNLNPVPIGDAGELYVGGSRLGAGYLNQPELTAEKFMASPFNDDPDAVIYKTGDLARYLPDGTLESLGRSDFQVKIRGFRIVLSEIEAALNQHEAIANAIVIAQQSDVPRLVAYLVSQSNQATPTTSELHQFLGAILPDYMIPSLFMTIDAIPTTPNGKVDRNALPTPDAARPELATAYTAPSNIIEETLAEIWQLVLNIDQIGIHDNFFELGGHSLIAVQISSRITQLFDITLPLTDIFDAPTIAELAQKIEEYVFIADGEDENFFEGEI